MDTKMNQSEGVIPIPPIPLGLSGKAGPNLGDEWSGDSRGPLWHDFETIASLKAE